jgi:hypothetical protein
LLSDPCKRAQQARQHTWANVIGCAQQVIVVPNVQVPQHAMQELGAVVRVERVAATRV